MRSCERCGKTFDEVLSKMSCGELQGAEYDGTLISTATDLRYCGKFCQKYAEDEAWQKMSKKEQQIYLGTFGISIGAISRSKRMKREQTVDMRDYKDTPLSRMERDKTMLKSIKSGHASDPALKRDAETIQREFEDRRKNRIREKDQRELHEMKKEYKLLPEQLKRHAG